MSARARLTISFTALFGAIVIALSIAAYALVRNDAYLKLNAALQVATGATAMSAEHELNEHSTMAAGEKDLQLVLDEAASSGLTDTQILVREESRDAAYTPGTQQGFDLRSVSPDGLRNGATVHGFQIATRTFHAPKFNTAYRIYAAKPIAPALVRLSRVRAGLFVFVPIGLGLAGALGYLLARRSLQPLQEFAHTVDAVTSSDLSARVKLHNKGDEIGKLGRHFNSLLERLEQAFQLQRRFMADASHQIRTPVTVALAAAQVTTRDSNASLRDCKDALQIVEHQMLQLRRTVEDMFFLSQADTGTLKSDRKEMYLDDAVTDAVRAAKTLASEKQQTLKLGTLPEAKCRGDGDLLKQAVLILLDNAVKFTPREGHIDVTLFRRGEHWVCSVTDNGFGISEAAQPRIFDRFFRESQQAKGAVAGTGLDWLSQNLSLESHAGTLTLVESRPGRTTFEIAISVLEDETGPEGDHANSLAVRM
ncbi:MAG: ATP-binding protein [Bryobacteraceae bacterium]